MTVTVAGSSQDLRYTFSGATEVTSNLRRVSPTQRVLAVMIIQVSCCSLQATCISVCLVSYGRWPSYLSKQACLALFSQTSPIHSKSQFMAKRSLAFSETIFVVIPFGDLFTGTRQSALPCGDYTMSAGDVAVIQSKNYPNKYANRHNCYWSFEVSFTCNLLGLVQRQH